MQQNFITNLNFTIMANKTKSAKSAKETAKRANDAKTVEAVEAVRLLRLLTWRAFPHRSQWQRRRKAAK